MKKIVFLLIGSIVLSAFFGSCKKEEEKDDSMTYAVVNTQTIYTMTFSVDYTMEGDPNGDGTYTYNGYYKTYIVGNDASLIGCLEFEPKTTSATQVVDIYYKVNCKEDSLDYIIENRLDVAIPMKNLVAKSYLIKTRLYETSGKLVYYVTENKCEKALGNTIPEASNDVTGKIHINMKNDYSYTKAGTKFYNNLEDFYTAIN